MTLPDVRQLSGDPPNVRHMLRGPLECQGVVGRHSIMSGRPFRMSGSGREALSDVRE